MRTIINSSLICALTLFVSVAAEEAWAKSYSSKSDVRSIEVITVDIAVPERLLTELEETAHPERAGRYTAQENENGQNNDRENRGTGKRNIRMLRTTNEL